ncbi:hypothetical protein GGI22_004399 [Coemansia erecta]|nr:hypothetical protein GGI22_004399 [Coemansia erecta]
MIALKYRKRQAPSGGLLPGLSGQGVMQGDVTLGGGILPTITLGGIINGNNNGFGAGASATVGLGGGPLPTVMAGGGAAAAMNGLVFNGALSATASQGGGFNSLLQPANVGGSVGAEAGLLVANGLHALAGVNGAGWATLGYGGIFIPPSSLAIDLGGNFGGIIDNIKATPT